MNKKDREEREYKSLFTDTRYAKKNMKKLMAKSLESDAANLPNIIDKNGIQTVHSIIYENAYNNVQARLKKEGLDRKPMKAEVMIESNVIRASFDASSFNQVMDRTVGKVKDEIMLNSNQFESLSDEELMLLAQHRKEDKGSE